MKRWKISTVVFILFIPVAMLNAEPKFGAGFILGEPSGITAKYFFNEKSAADFGIGPSVHDGFYLYGDFLRHFGNLFPANELILYVGAGAGYYDYNDYHNHRHDSDNGLEVRMPFGLEYTFKQIPIGVFGEIVPSTEIIPDIDFHLRAGIGARYYF